MLKKLISSQLLLVISISFSWIGFSYAEYIIYKKGPTPLPITDQKEYVKIYTILMNYQWPMVIGYANKMSPDELQEISSPKESAEVQFLRKKIKEVSSDYDIVLLPTILYEFFVLAHVGKIPELSKFNIMMQETPNNSITSLQMKEFIENPQTPIQSWYDYYRKINMKQETLLAHQAVNNALVEYLKKFDKSATTLSNIFKKYINQITLEMSALMDFKNNPSLAYLNSPQAIKSLLGAEIEALRTNSGLLYRGGRPLSLYVVGRPTATQQAQEPIEMYFLAEMKNQTPTFAELKERYVKRQKSLEFTPWQAGTPLGSISFGNSLLAGYLGDPGACAAVYFHNRLGYALLVNKHDFLFGSLKNILNQSLFSTLVGLCAEGEYFHSRTVSYVDHVIPVTNFKGLADTLPFDKAGLLLRQGNPLQKSYELSDYFAHHSLILRLADGTFSPSPERIKKYVQAQNEVTQMLKAMATIKQFMGQHKTILSQINKEAHKQIMDAVASSTTEAIEQLKNSIKNKPLVMKYMEQELVTACIFNNLPVAKALLLAGISPNTQMNSFTILMGTAALENNNALDELINAGADLNIQDSLGYTALLLAVNLGNYNQAAKLLKAGADPNIPETENGLAPLDITEQILAKRDPQIANKLNKLLLQYNAKSSEDIPVQHGAPTGIISPQVQPIQQAVVYATPKQPGATSGTSIPQKSIQQISIPATPMKSAPSAAFSYQPSIAAQTIPQKPLDQHLVDAISAGNLTVVNSILSSPLNINVNRIDPQTGKTLLMIAAMKNLGSIVQRLLKYPTINIKVTNAQGETALMLAIQALAYNSVQVLLSDPRIATIINDKNSSGKTALDLAIAKNIPEATINQLRSRGAKTSGEL